MFRLNLQKKHQSHNDLNINNQCLILLDTFGVKKQSWLTVRMSCHWGGTETVTQRKTCPPGIWGDSGAPCLCNTAKNRGVGTCCFYLTMSMQMDEGTRDCWAAQRTKAPTARNYWYTYAEPGSKCFKYERKCYLVGANYHWLSYSAKRNIASTVPNHTKLVFTRANFKWINEGSESFTAGH